MTNIGPGRRDYSQFKRRSHIDDSTEAEAVCKRDTEATEKLLLRLQMYHPTKDKPGIQDFPGGTIQQHSKKGLQR